MGNYYTNISNPDNHEVCFDSSKKKFIVSLKELQAVINRERADKTAETVRQGFLKLEGFAFNFVLKHKHTADLYYENETFTIKTLSGWHRHWMGKRRYTHENVFYHINAYKNIQDPNNIIDECKCLLTQDLFNMYTYLKKN